MNTSFATCRSGISICWGLGQYGKLGYEIRQEINTQSRGKSQGCKMKKSKKLPAGPFHTLALTDKGEILAFGNSKDEKLGV